MWFIAANDVSLVDHPDFMLFLCNLKLQLFMNTEIAFVPVGESHVEAIRDIYNYYVEHTTVTFHSELLDNEEMRSILFFKNPRFGSYAIINPEQMVIGYVILGYYKPRQAYDFTAEVTIYLHPAHIGKGIGNKSMNFIEKIAREKQFHALLGVICSENGSSIQLFKKFGYWECAYFKEVGLKYNRLLDVVVYEKILES
jgi:phosphinothricin acetyltransferase